MNLNAKQIRRVRALYRQKDCAHCKYIVDIGEASYFCMNKDAKDDIGRYLDTSGFGIPRAGLARPGRASNCKCWSADHKLIRDFLNLLESDKLDLYDYMVLVRDFLRSKKIYLRYYKLIKNRISCTK